MVIDDRKMKRLLTSISRQKSHQEEKALKEKSKARRAEHKEIPRTSAEIDEDNWEAVEQREETRRKQSKLPKRALRERGAAASTEASTKAADHLPHETAMVVSTTRRWCKVLRDGALIDCALPRDLAAAQRSAIAVGDRVVIAKRADRFVIEQVLPRTTKLSRPDPHTEDLERVVAANIDTVVHLVSVKSPPLRPGLIDRYLVAIQRGGAEPAICVNKIDLVEPEELDAEKRKLDVYLQLEVPLVFVSASSGEGISELHDVLRGKTAVMVGHSGVGKSSVINALHPQLALKTGEVHKHGAGRHTTTSSFLYDLGDGTLLIDTPGIREFGFWQLDPETLRWHFPEFAAAAEFCRFADCTHTHEPVCGVKEAVLEGRLSAPRYETYLRLFKEVGSV
jgi:ribosome biogenesis GTPase